jgi:hypothetical protein
VVVGDDGGEFCLARGNACALERDRLRLTRLRVKRKRESPSAKNQEQAVAFLKKSSAKNF